MSFDGVKGFRVRVERTSESEKKSEKEVRAQRSQCRTTHKRQDC
jgi:hypothetical protein